MTAGEFRNWVRLRWEENCIEHDAFNEPAHSLSHYFNQYKWWLRREFRYQQSKQ